jgi:hypothetical protein
VAQKAAELKWAEEAKQAEEELRGLEDAAEQAVAAADAAKEKALESTKNAAAASTALRATALKEAARMVEASAIAQRSAEDAAQAVRDKVTLMAEEAAVRAAKAERQDISTHHGHAGPGAPAESLDNCRAHAGRDGDLHYHGQSLCTVAESPFGHSLPIALMADGYLLYGRYSLDHVIPEDLDRCGGHIHRSDQPPIRYHYHVGRNGEMPSCWSGVFPESLFSEHSVHSLVLVPHGSEGSHLW